MSIDFDKFLNWAESRFGDVIVSGNEIKVNSIFCEDYKRHLWCNPSGGKKDRDYGVYHCWKSGEKGTLVGLVMKVDHCTYEEALETLETGDMSLAKMEQMIDDFFSTKEESPQIPILESSQLQLPPETYKILDLPEDDYFRSQAEIYLKGRLIPPDDLMVCVNGDYKNRIVIPYFDPDHKLIYYNSRYIGQNKNVIRYMGPPKSMGVGKGDVIFMPKWPGSGEEIFVCEGEFDAISLCVAGLNGCAMGGKNLLATQAEYLINYIPTLCLDNDSSGADATPKLGEALKMFGSRKLWYIRPPKGFKDWNAMLVDLGPKLVSAYILSKRKQFTQWTAESLRLRNL